MVLKQRQQTVGELNLALGARLCILKALEDLRWKDVAANYG